MTIFDILRLALESVIGTAATGILAYIGMRIKKKLDAREERETIEKYATNTARYVEQLYKNLTGEEKARKFNEAMLEVLATKDIYITDLELHMQREAAVNALNASDWKGTDGLYEEVSSPVEPEDEIAEEEC